MEKSYASMLDLKQSFANEPISASGLSGWRRPALEV
jgi:hypothetical protein